jgi:very-short-patch-repair endonuclease
LRHHGLPEPTLQYEVRDGDGNLLGRVDAAYPNARVAIEYDSKQEHSDEFQLARDARRRNRIASEGWVYLSARHRDLVGGGSELAAAIEAAIERNRRRTTTDAVVS